MKWGWNFFSLFQFNINSFNFRLWASTLCLSWWHRCHYCFLIEYIRLESICCFSLSFMLYIISFIVHIISCIASSTMKLKQNMPNNNVVYFVSLRAMKNVLLFFSFYSIRNYSVILFFYFSRTIFEIIAWILQNELHTNGPDVMNFQCWKWRTARNNSMKMKNWKLRMFFNP